MDNNFEIMRQFAENYDLGCPAFDLDGECRKFIREMERGLDGEKSSLRMIPTYISMENDLTVDKSVIVIDAGGTNLRVAVVRVSGRKELVVESFDKYPMPGAAGEISAEEFFGTIADYLMPVLDKSDTISFCFSYAIEPLDDKDCKVLEIRKQLNVKGLIGEKIGSRLNAELRRRHLGAKQIIVFNDSVSTLLAGRATVVDRKFDGFVGFILGTGTNTCYMEDVSNIQKLSGSKVSGSMLINTESGGYGCFPLPGLVELFDRSTGDPGKYIYEKMISGKYQGPLALTAIQTACQDGIFSASFAARADNLKRLEAAEVDSFIDSRGTKGALAQCLTEPLQERSDDRQRLLYLLDLIAEHTSALVTVNLAAVLIKSKRKGTGYPVCISLDGSVCNHSKTFTDKLNKNFNNYVLGKLGIRSEFVYVKDASLLGAAIAGLMN